MRYGHEKKDDPDPWQEAQDRVLLYLKKLGVPALRSLEVAGEALRKAAEEAPFAGTAPPLVLAMRALQMILLHNPGILDCTPYVQYPILYRRWHPENLTMPSCNATDPVTGLQTAALPPINRASMTIKRL